MTTLVAALSASKTLKQSIRRTAITPMSLEMSQREGLKICHSRALFSLALRSGSNHDEIRNVEAAARAELSHPLSVLNAINSATQCSGMRPPSAKFMLPSSATECCHLRRSPKGVQSLVHAGGVRLG